MVIRSAIPEDLDRIYQITISSFGPYCRVGLREDLYGVVDGIGWEQRKGTSVRDFCEHNLNNVLVAEDDGHVVGYYTYGLDPDHGIGQLKVNAVHPTYQGRGIGTRLAQATLERIQLSNRIKILLVCTIMRDRPARRVYEKLGFKELARSVDYTALKSELEPGPMDPDPSLIIRAVKTEDLQRIRQIAAEDVNSFGRDCLTLEPMQQRHGIIGGKTSRQRRVERAQAFCAAETNRVYVAERNGATLGYGGFTYLGGSEVSFIYPSVDPAYKVPMLRRWLMRKLLDNIKTKTSSAMLSVSLAHEDHDGQSTCEGMGFTELTRGITYSMWKHDAVSDA